MKFANYNYKERLQKFIFERNWIELPLFWNNDESIRFDFESRSEKNSADTIKAVFDDLFFADSAMLVVLYGCKDIRASSGRSKYFNVMRMRRIFKQHFESRDKWNYDKDDNPYIVAYKTNRKYFKLEKYLADYFADEQCVNMVIISLKKGVALQMYDSRGMDLVVNDEALLKRLKEKYSEYLMEKDESLNKDVDCEDCKKCDKKNCTMRKE